MSKNKTEYFYSISSERELNTLLEGREAGTCVKWKPPVSSQIESGFTGVIWKRHGDRGHILPLVVVVRNDDLRRLCARLSQFRSDFSPLTAWCHVLSPQELENLNSLDLKPNLRGFEAAWTGLIVAEAHLLAGRSVADLRISACLATQSFAVARATALWTRVTPGAVIERYDAINKLVNKTIGDRASIPIGQLRLTFFAIWNALAALSDSRTEYDTSEVEPIVASLKGLLKARMNSEKNSNEAECFASPLMQIVPEARELLKLKHFTPERRLQLFDNLMENLGSTSPIRERLRSTTLPLILGYLATVVAGGKPSLHLAETHARRWPQILAWAYVVGGVGQSVLWTSSFDGLGRLVARELTRTCRLGEPPTCDFALNEGMALTDPQLSDPFVFLRIKQAKIVNILLMPGVNVAVSIGDDMGVNRRKQKTRAQREQERILTVSGSNPIPVLAEALWPHFRTRVETIVEKSLTQRAFGTRQRNMSKHRKGKKRGTQEKLSLGTED